MIRNGLAIICPCLLLMLMTGACDPYSEGPAPVSSNAAESWRGTYRGEGEFTSPSRDIHNLGVDLTIQCIPSGSEVFVNMSLSSYQPGYLPTYRLTYGVNSGESISYIVQIGDYVYRSILSRDGDRLQGILMVSDSGGELIWRMNEIAASRD